jgi:predicted NUDIX family NTP pyrophosphohydrolase
MSQQVDAPHAGTLADFGSVPSAGSKRSAGILLYRFRDGEPEVLLVHPGGPFWARRDSRAWSIPKGEYGEDEEARVCAAREFEEETGTALPPGELIELGDVQQKGGKVVRAFAAEGDLDADSVRSNTFTMEWPPRSGRTAEFPEIDRAAWFGVATARQKMVEAQAAFLDRLLEKLRSAAR